MLSENHFLNIIFDIAFVNSFWKLFLILFFEHRFWNSFLKLVLETRFWKLFWKSCLEIVFETCFLKALLASRGRTRRVVWNFWTMRLRPPHKFLPSSAGVFQRVCPIGWCSFSAHWSIALREKKGRQGLFWNPRCAVAKWCTEMFFCLGVQRWYFTYFYLCRSSCIAVFKSPPHSVFILAIGCENESVGIAAEVQSDEENGGCQQQCCQDPAAASRLCRT